MAKNILLFFPDGNTREYASVIDFTVIPEGALVFQPQPAIDNPVRKVVTTLPFMMIET